MNTLFSSTAQAEASNKLEMVTQNQSKEIRLAGGVLLCFCGGSFMITMATVEAACAAGLEKIVSQIKELISYSAAITDGKDDDKKQAGSHVFTTFLAGVAAIRSHLARSVIYGCCLGERAGDFILEHGKDVVAKVVPDEYKNGFPKFLKTSLKITGMVLAWRFQRLISAIQCGMRGSDAITSAAIAYVDKDRKPGAPPRDLRPFRLIGWTVMGCGVSYQMYRGFHPPAFLATLSLIEYGLSQIVSALQNSMKIQAWPTRT